MATTYKVKKPTSASQYLPQGGGFLGPAKEGGSPAGAGTAGFPKPQQEIKLPTGAIEGYGTQAGAPPASTDPPWLQRTPDDPLGWKSIAAHNTPSPGAPPAAAPPYQPPPPTVDSQTNRINAQGDYTSALPDLNYQLWQAAFDYGGAPNARQFEYTPGGYDSTQRLLEGSDAETTKETGANPNSQLANLQRQLGLDRTAQNVAAGNVNSFFSGANLDAQNRLNDAEGRGEVGAREAYESAVNKVVGLILQAQQARHRAWNTAGASDVDAAAAQPPVAETPAPATPAAQAQATANNTGQPQGVKGAAGAVTGGYQFPFPGPSQSQLNEFPAPGTALPTGGVARGPARVPNLSEFPKAGTALPTGGTVPTKKVKKKK